MKINFIILIIVFLFSIGFSQQKPAQKNTDENKTSYKKNKASNILDLQKSNKKIEFQKEKNKNSNKSKTNEKFGSSKNSGPEIKLNKEKNQIVISNEELKKKLNNPRKLKKKN